MITPLVISHGTFTINNASATWHRALSTSECLNWMLVEADRSDGLMFLSRALDYVFVYFPSVIMHVLELGFVIFHNSQLREPNEISIALRFSYFSIRSKFE